MHSIKVEVVAYRSDDRYSITFRANVMYVEITPHKGVLRWPDPPPIPFAQFLGYYTEEEFEKKKNSDAFQAHYWA